MLAGMLSYLAPLKDCTRPYAARSATVSASPTSQPLLLAASTRCGHTAQRVSADDGRPAHASTAQARLDGGEPAQERSCGERLAQRRFLGRVRLLAGRRQQRVQVNQVEQHLLHLQAGGQRNASAQSRRSRSATGTPCGARLCGLQRVLRHELRQPAGVHQDGVALPELHAVHFQHLRPSGCFQWAPKSLLASPAACACCALQLRRTARRRGVCVLRVHASARAQCAPEPSVHAPGSARRAFALSLRASPHARSAYLRRARPRCGAPGASVPRAP
jgi:hypothetical protein